MKREELYNKVMEISTQYNLPVRIDKKTRKAELQKIYNNMSNITLKKEDDFLDDDIKNLLNDYEFDKIDSNGAGYITETSQELYEPEKDEDEDDDEDDDDYDELEEIEDLEKPVEIKPRKVKSVRMEKILKQSINSLKRDVNAIIKDYNKECDELMASIEEIKDITDEEIDMAITNYNEIREDVENEINLALETHEGKIPESFYVLVESQLDRKKKQIEKLLH